MDTTLLLFLNGAYQRVDIFEDIQITITIQQSDLTNLNGRRTPYSKVIQIPSTSNNDILLEHFFEPNGIDYNPLFKVPAVVQYRGTDIFSGVLRLNSVVSTGGKRYYEVYILGEVSDFTTEFKQVLLQDLNWSELTHELNYSAVTSSWYANGDGVSGIFNGNVIYPLINYGLEYQGASSASTYSMSFGEDNSFDKPQYAIPPENFKPALKLKYVLDKIFETTQYKVNSTFFDTDYFKSIYMRRVNAPRRPIWDGYRAQRPPGRPLHDAGRHDGDGPGDDAGGPARRPDDGRDHVPRQHHDEGLP